MIRFIFISVLLCVFNVTAQKGNAVLNFPNSVVLYEKYSSVLKVGFTEKNTKKWRLECEGCDTIYQKSGNEPTEFVVIPGDSGKIVLKLRDRRKNIIVERFEIKVVKLPVPMLKINNQDSQQTVTGLPEYLVLENAPSVPITSGYVITGWTIKIQDTVFTGSDSKLTEEVKNYLREMEKGILTIEVIYKDYTGQHTMKEIVEFRI